MQLTAQDPTKTIDIPIGQLRVRTCLWSDLTYRIEGQIWQSLARFDFDPDDAARPSFGTAVECADFDFDRTFSGNLITIRQIDALELESIVSRIPVLGRADWTNQSMRMLTELGAETWGPAEANRIRHAQTSIRAACVRQRWLGSVQVTP